MRNPVIVALLRDRKKRKEGRRSQARRIGVAESTLRASEAAKAPRRGTLLIIAAALDRGDK